MPSDAEGGTTRAVVLVLDGDVEVVLWRMDGMPDPDLWVVDALARLQLAARQMGGSIRLRNPCERLREPRMVLHVAVDRQDAFLGDDDAVVGVAVGTDEDEDAVGNFGQLTLHELHAHFPLLPIGSPGPSAARGVLSAAATAADALGFR